MPMQQTNAPIPTKNVPLQLENLPDFFIGNRQTLRIQITKEGELPKGILDFGTITSAEGAQFTGYIAAIKKNNENFMEISLD